MARLLRRCPASGAAAGLLGLVLAAGCAQGTLLIGGGGSLPPAVFEEFTRLAGGAQGILVVIPTASASADVPAETEATRGRWRERGFAHVDVLHTRDRAVAERDDFVAPLRRATAVWIGGGDQSRLTEAYGGTRVEAELHALLARGGVIGGTSAGAACMSKVMIRGTRPQPGQDGELAELGAGLGFLPWALVDQHFTQRQRRPRLADSVQRAEPPLLGIGVDERTAALVRGDQLRVIGDGQVTLVVAVPGGAPRDVVLAPGATADLGAYR